MVKSAKEIQAELQAYLAGKTEKDLNVSDNVLIGIQLRSNDPNWKKANEQRRIDDPNYDKKVAKKISATYSTDQGRAVQSAKSKPHTQAAKDKIAKANIGLVKGPEIRIKLSEKKIGNNNRGQPIVTPLGIFSSKRYASEAYLASGKANALKWIEKWLKTDKANFYYISKEEYIMLTGKDI